MPQKVLNSGVLWFDLYFKRFRCVRFRMFVRLSGNVDGAAGNVSPEFIV